MSWLVLKFDVLFLIIFYKTFIIFRCNIIREENHYPSMQAFFVICHLGMNMLTIEKFSKFKIILLCARRILFSIYRKFGA